MKLSNREQMIKRKHFLDERALWIMLIPVIIYFVLFKYAPVYGIIIAFQRFSPFKGMLNSPWVGFQYFQQFFDSVYFGRVMRNTLGIGMVTLIFGFPMPIILAIMLNGLKNRTFRKTTQTLTLLPYFVSVVVIASIFINFLSPSTGIVNKIITIFGGEPVFFMQEPKYFWGIYTIMKIFKQTGYDAIIYMAALIIIDPTLYEAAEVDGAGKLKQLVNVTLPCLTPTIIIMFLMRVGRIIDIAFEEVLLLQNDVILETSEVISTFVYRRGLIGADYSYATAVGLFQTVVALILVFSANAIARRFRSDSALF
ncbi:MAG: ABC transporter permease subunit [Spirochaetaceae bacterium]|jgi:putative aldouronate transport system permease protein|nr:ABC transporter permease subunit [Spirochaetaceae bacterium]